MAPTLYLGRDVCGTFQRAVEREWLVSNGLGGFAAGTVSTTNTRRYHGLLIAALKPPVARTLLVAAVETRVNYAGQHYALAAHEFSDGTLAPRGYLYLESFHLDNGLPVWRYALADALLEQRLLMNPGANTSYMHFHVLRAGAALDLELTPLCTHRDYHSQGHGGQDPALREISNGVEIDAFPGAHRYRLTCAAAAFERDPAWYWHFKHRAESARGLDDSEDLFRPGRFTLRLAPGEHATLVMSAEADLAEAFAPVQARVHKQQTDRLDHLAADAPDWVRQLTLAAGQFVVERYRTDRPAGKTIIAGYPWFSDWGRDTMIALPGLTLSTRRYAIAASILRTFAAHVSDGMLPNRFPDDGEAPEYNTVDASLWYFQAIDQYSRHSGDLELAAELYPVLVDILDWHRRGTRFGIKVDAHDGLLAAGQDGVQLTWMDAKVGDWVVTPRIGKAVEVNALWFNALHIMAGLAARLDKAPQALEYKNAAALAKTGFQRFWNAARGCLYDAIDGPDGKTGADARNYDDRLRPNQLFAVSLPYSPLDAARQKSVVDVCARELLTSHGLRSLARGEPGYVEHYQGGPLQRDAAYHQGTVWAWLIGPFVDAHYRVYQDSAVAGSFLEPLGLHLSAACVGSVSEVFDAEPPFTPRGCFAQAWSVSELLRAWSDLYRQQGNTR